MPSLGKQENCKPVLVKNEAHLPNLKNKDQRKRLVQEILNYLDSSQSAQETDALRTENRKLKNANSRLRYKTKDWALKKEEYEKEIERLSGELSSYVNVTNFWMTVVADDGRITEPESRRASVPGGDSSPSVDGKYEESDLRSGQDKRTLRGPRKHASTQTEGALGLKKR